jgi:ligand-binding sensor domain-containing protein
MKNVLIKISLAAVPIILFLVCSSCKYTPTTSSVPPRDVPWKIYTTANSKLVNNTINVVVIDGGGYKWFGTNDGASRYRKGTWESFKKVLEFTGIAGTSRKVNAITFGADDHVWFGLAGGGLRRMIKGSTLPLTDYTSPDLSSDMIYSLFTDNNGFIWIGTAKGVCRFIPLPSDPKAGQWTQYTSANSPIPDEPIKCIGINPLDNILWFGTYTQGVVSYNNDLDWNISAPTDNPLPITAIGFNYSNSGWFGTFADWVYKFNVNTTEWIQYGDSARGGGLPDNFVNAIAIDPRGGVWFGTNKGLVKFNGSQWKTWNKSNSQIPSDIVKSLAIELNGNLWIGTPSGVAEFNEDGIIN